MTRMNASVCMYAMSSDTSSWRTKYVMTEASVITNVTAMPMPNAVSVFFETPRNGQMPMNLFITKLLTSTPPTKISIRFILPPPFCAASGRSAR